MQEDNTGSNSSTGHGTQTQKPIKKKHPMTTEVMGKLNMVMDRFDSIERRLDQQEQIRNASLSILSCPSAVCLNRSHYSTNPPARQLKPTYTSHSLLLNTLGDSDIQAEVDRRLRHYEDFNKDEAQGTSNKLKSNRYL